MVPVEIDVKAVPAEALVLAVPAGGLPGNGPVTVTWCSRFETAPSVPVGHAAAPGNSKIKSFYQGRGRG